MKGEMSEETIEAIIKAEEEYQRIMADPRAQRLIERMEMARYDRAAEKYYAEKIGREEGRKDERIEIAKKLKTMNMAIEDIQKATGLTKEEIEKF